MKHSFRELYTLHNHKGTVRYATEAYINANNIPVDDFSHESLRNKGVLCAHYALYATSHIKPIKVLDTDGVKLIYLFGEKTWFDTEEERDAYREQARIEREKEIERNKVKKAIIEKLDRMSKADLEKILENL